MDRSLSLSAEAATDRSPDQRAETTTDRCLSLSAEAATDHSPSLRAAAGKDRSHSLPAETTMDRTPSVRVAPTARGSIGLRAAVAWTAATALAFLLAEGLIFRSGWYYQWIEPASSAGMVEGYLHWLRESPRGPAAEAVVLGDSRIAHALSAPAASAASGGKLRFWNLGIMGTLPRDWYYILRDADPTRRRFAAVVLALDQYSDEDYADTYADRVIDLNFLIGRLRLGDCWEFAASMQSPKNRAHALAGCLLKGIALRRDVRELVADWPARAARAKTWREHGLDYVNSFPGIDRDLRGLRADWDAHTIAFPQGIDEDTRASIQATVMPHWPPYSGETTRYRKRWLPRIFDLYKDSPTRVILLELPRAPLPKPESSTPRFFLSSALPRAGVVALDSGTFHDLERPEYFFDGLHLNRAGRALFSARLGREVAELVGAR
jgi:hypothetical protein